MSNKNPSLCVMTKFADVLEENRHQNSLPLMIKWMATFLPLWKRQISYYHLLLCLFIVKFETCFTFLSPQCGYLYLINTLLLFLHFSTARCPAWICCIMSRCIDCGMAGLFSLISSPLYMHKCPRAEENLEQTPFDHPFWVTWDTLCPEWSSATHSVAEDRSLSLALFAATCHPMLEGSSRHVYVGFRIISHRADQHVWFWWSRNVLSSCK